MENTPMLMVAEVARLLDCGEQTVRRLIDRGVLPATRTAKGVRLVTRSDAERVRTERAFEVLVEAADEGEDGQ
jgi:excisionase family DNA binding protein